MTHKEFYKHIYFYWVQRNIGAIIIVIIRTFADDCKLDTSNKSTFFPISDSISTYS